jgi:hypothetical protein
MAKTGGMAREMWKLLGRRKREHRIRCSRIVSGSVIDDELVAAKLFRMWWPEMGSNRRRRPFQRWPRVSTKTVSSDPTPANRAGELQQ